MLRLVRQAPLFALASIVAAPVAASPASGDGSSASATGRAAACPKLSKAASLPVWKKSRVAFGDVEGSGYRGRATIRYAKDASSICGFILVVKTRKGFLAARVPEMDYGKGSAMPIRDWRYAYGPTVGTVVRLGGGRSQFIVGRWSGASTFFISLYGVLDGKLAMIPFHGGPAPGRSGLGLGGTAAASTSVRCVRGGPLTILSLSGWNEQGKLVGRFSRYTYRLRPDGFRLTQTKTTTGSYTTIYALAARSGINRSGFKGCAVD